MSGSFQSYIKMFFRNSKKYVIESFLKLIYIHYLQFIKGYLELHSP